MTIQEILDQLTIIQANNLSAMEPAGMLYILAAVMSIALLWGTSHTDRSDLDSKDIAIEIGMGLGALTVLVVAIIVTCNSQSLSYLQLVAEVNDDFPLRELPSYFEVSDITLTPYGKQMTLTIGYENSAFEAVLTALKAANIEIHGFPI